MLEPPIVCAHLSWFGISHVLFSFVAFGFLSASALQAALLYMQDRALKNRRTGLLPALVQQLPPLQTMERVLFRMMTFGFIGLTASLLSTVFYIRPMQTQPQKIILAGLTWILFAGILYRHYRFGFRGLKAIQWTLIGVGLLTSVFLAQRLSVLQS